VERLDERPSWGPKLDLLALGLFCLGWSLAARTLWSEPGEPPALLFVLAFPVALLLSDLGSGAVHWFADTFFEADTPVIGRALIRPFREHHVDPTAMNEHGFLEISGNSALVCVPLLFALLLFPVGFFWRAVLLWAALAVLVTNQIHKWAHMPAERVPARVRWLQQYRLLLAPRQHALHHAAAHDQSYCITGGWSNTALDRLRIFSRSEAAVRGLQRRLSSFSTNPSRRER
jgi:ubiquitin-conjugating enzyme E2 variant